MTTSTITLLAHALTKPAAGASTHLIPIAVELVFGAILAGLVVRIVHHQRGERRSLTSELPKVAPAPPTAPETEHPQSESLTVPAEPRHDMPARPPVPFEEAHPGVIAILRLKSEHRASPIVGTSNKPANLGT